MDEGPDEVSWILPAKGRLSFGDQHGVGGPRRRHPSLTKIATMRGHSFCLLAVLAILASAAMRADAKPSFTMPEEDADEGEVEVAIEVEVDNQGIKTIRHFLTCLQSGPWDKILAVKWPFPITGEPFMKCTTLYSLLQPVVETPAPVTEPPPKDAEEEAEETPARTSSKGTFSLLLSKGNWFRSFFR